MDFIVQPDKHVRIIAASPGYAKIVELLKAHEQRAIAEVGNPENVVSHPVLAQRAGALNEVRCLLAELEILSGEELEPPPPVKSRL